MAPMTSGSRNTFKIPIDEDTRNFIAKHGVRIVRHENTRAICAVLCVQRILFHLEEETATFFTNTQPGSLVSRLLGAMIDDYKDLDLDEVRHANMDPVGIMVADGVMAGANIRAPGKFRGQCPRQILKACFAPFSGSYQREVCAFRATLRSWEEIVVEWGRGKGTAIFNADSFPLHQYVEEIAAIDCKIVLLLKLPTTKDSWHGTVIVHLPGEDCWLIQDNQHVFLRKTKEILAYCRLSRVAESRGARVVCVGFFPPAKPVSELPLYCTKPSRFKANHGKPEPFSPCWECDACGGMREYEDFLKGKSDEEEETPAAGKKLRIESADRVEAVMVEMDDSVRLVKGFNRAGTYKKNWRIGLKSEKWWFCRGDKCRHRDAFPMDPLNMDPEGLKSHINQYHYEKGCWTYATMGRPKKR